MRCVLALTFVLAVVSAAARYPAAARRSVAATPVRTAACRSVWAATPTATRTDAAARSVQPTPTPFLDLETRVDPLLAPMVATAVADFQACWNATDWAGVASLVTPRFLKTALGIDTPQSEERVRALGALALGPIEIEQVGPVGIWSDGRAAVDVVYRRGAGRPQQVIAARWFVIASRGIAHIDEEALLAPPPLGDRVTLGFTIPDDQQRLQWDSGDAGNVPVSPVVALHGANRGLRPHTLLLESADGSRVGLLTLPSWQQGDLVLLDLPPGAYHLRDPAVAGSALTLLVG
jgi:hypothetical protein